MMCSLTLFIAVLLAAWVTKAKAYKLYTHGADFVPDEILRVTFQNASMSCASRPSVLVNGTVPGPGLRFREDKTTWVRVFNDMPDQNLTMVSSYDL